MDDYELPPEAQPLIDWYKYLQEASRRFGKPIDCPDVDALMTQCGFAETNHRTIRLPLRHRALDVRDRDLSDGLKNAMCYQYDDGSEPKLFESLSMSLFTRQLGMQRIEVENWCARLREIAGTEDMPIFFNL